jgi:hypothetical protein
MALCAMGWCESPKRRYGSGFFRSLRTTPQQPVAAASPP